MKSQRFGIAWWRWLALIVALRGLMISAGVAGAVDATGATGFIVDTGDDEPVYVVVTFAEPMTAIDLLWDDAAPARQILADFEPAMTKDQYLAFERGLFRTERWKAGA